ncbi:3-hydroxybutyryl-CoA dehydrogenase [Clostridium acetobutylicum]|uniref:3-Hydroxyacyl-CoA dehydrogenase n=2 Tax=Clostridium acetobutylicum TaxID=1488 RepID=Q97HK2_CLOAB|nr:MULTISPECIES: 3-hydroxyacyl-CoA dehydrogenase family protein [Clostridium]AAK79968.1 3-Hydroxyacyl-CoA dehydrogenase [Clostridium acetobutylicum ATCC 824]ADZ21061.1 3-Hydroxyacyl-CoA dehydrogenase [Clostridium acetobutylicum EA 2018]AEI33476.1 3-hydroxyacyl-CoA dehydrogenase [Clostridium acetobutylicum DSM 1731]AWV79600.1 3-hydroxyacyl-CoA dehydrogenase family protein [Clostridium acetobutylicum]MBC2394426.1 3-hydroxyacyl-CoA dehydrogenase family protein [Clostridium acetobutylicum]
MEIGIIGKGKMGRDIFNYISMFDYKVILICRQAEQVEEVKSSIEKQLRKKLKRNLITEEEYNSKKDAYKVTDNIQDLKNCDIIIEAIYEDEVLKQNILGDVEKIVKDECILATNTSSIPLEIVFAKCVKKERCLGLHFFFPVKIIDFVEINELRCTESRYVETIVQFLTTIGKTSLDLDEKSNFVLTRILTTIVIQIYVIYKENYLSIEQIEKEVKQNFLTFGGFEIIDATGINIIIKAIENFNSPRYEKLYNILHYNAKKALEQGFAGGSNNKGIIEYELKYLKKPFKLKEDELDKYKKNVILRLQSLLINEMAFYINNTGIQKQKISNAIEEVLGLRENPIAMLKRIGIEEVKTSLVSSYKAQENELYYPVELLALI